MAEEEGHQFPTKTFRMAPGTADRLEAVKIAGGYEDYDTLFNKLMNAYLSKYPRAKARMPK